MNRNLQKIYSWISNEMTSFNIRHFASKYPPLKFRNFRIKVGVFRGKGTDEDVF